MELKFGKYKGLDVRDPEVPTQYLRWLHNTSLEQAEELHSEIMRRLATVDLEDYEDSADSSWLERIVQSGFRALAMKFHPDHGGTNDAMRELIGASAELRRLIEPLGRAKAGRR